MRRFAVQVLDGQWMGIECENWTGGAYGIMFLGEQATRRRHIVALFAPGGFLFCRELGPGEDWEKGPHGPQVILKDGETIILS